jgi:hypothetical protein
MTKDLSGINQLFTRTLHNPWCHNSPLAARHSTGLSKRTLGDILKIVLVTRTGVVHGMQSTCHREVGLHAFWNWWLADQLQSLGWAEMR